MNESLLQSGRTAEFTTPLGEDVLVLTDFSGSEGLGELFEYHIDALSDKEDINFDDAIGQGCMVKFKTDDGKTRIYHGIMTEARWIGWRDEYCHYRVVLRPWLWLLGHKANCRIFLDKTLKDIFNEIFKDEGFSDYEWLASGAEKLEYCVQYRETDLAFVCRLMEHYGIYYFFEPSEGKHTLVFADSRSSHKPIPDLPKVALNQSARGFQDDKQTLSEWVSERRFRTGKVQFNDYDYESPGKNLKAPKEAAEKYRHSNLEVYDYHYKYNDKGKGEKLAQYRLEAEQALDHRRSASGDTASLYPGGLVTLEKHPTQAENKEYLIVHASHHFSEQHYRSRDAGQPPQGYAGSYVFQPSDRPFRSLPLTPKPRIYGIQTARVVAKKGEEGEEISTDEQGRIWVQFHWDREPQKSCPVRVAQVWAGSSWGGQFIPRIGMEVVVDFLEGDPDRPLVTGCVYNGSHRLPYDLPNNKTQSGWKSDSSQGHNGYNELMFEDKKGSEFIRMRAEKDHKVTIQNSETTEIGEKFMPPMGSPSRQTTLKNGDDNLTLNMGNQNVTLQTGNQTVNLQVGSQTIRLDIGAQTVQAMTGITLNVCMGLSSIAITPASISLMAPMINLTAEAAVTITAPLTTIPGPCTIAPGPLGGVGAVVPP